MQVMIEGPGHIPMDKIKEQVEKENESATKLRSTRSARSSPTSLPATTTSPPPSERP